MRSSDNCKIDSIHQTDSIVATPACGVAIKMLKINFDSQDNFSTRVKINYVDQGTKIFYIARQVVPNGCCAV